MAPAEFKLSKLNITRRVAFPERPTWKPLAARISGLFDIPLDRVAVSYIDADDDTVTLNTDDELTYFYQTCKQSCPIKLFVQDLLSIRSRPSGAISAERPFYRDTFGQEALIEDEWHWDPDFLPVVPEAIFQSSQHGFVEEVSSVSDNKPSSGKPGTNTTNSDKGKGRVVSVEDASRLSIFGVPSPKHPIHVYDASGIIPALAESTPKTPQSEIGKVETNKSEASAPPKPQNIADDPPLPSIEPLTSPSLPDDITNLFSSLCDVISSHPDVLEGFRNIIRNASDGSYWRAHREGLSRAAAEVSQASGTAMQGALHEAEAEAGRRVYGALDALFRTFSQTSEIPLTEPGSTSNSTNEAAQRPTDETVQHLSNETTQQNETGNVTVQGNAPITSRAAEPPTSSNKRGTATSYTEAPKQERATFLSRSTDWQSFLVPPPPPPVPRAPHVHSPFNMSSFESGPPPSRPSSFVQPLATSVPSPFPPLPHAAPPPPPGAEGFASPRTRNLDQLYGYPTSPTGSRAPEVVDLVAKARAAKDMYRNEKVRYFQERRQTRKDRKGKTQHGIDQRETEEFKPSEGLRSFIDATEGPVSQIISNARGPYPQLEIISIPGSFTPTPRHAFTESALDDFRSRAVKRICRQLADMGFMESQHPGLADNVSARLPLTGSITKEIEDGIVTNLLEELLPLASPSASGSGPGMRSKGRN